MADSKKYNGSTWEHSLRKLTTATEIIVPPTTIYADGNNATVGLKGNTVQNGTPTPDNPVEVNGVGVRTANLFDYNVTWWRNNINNSTNHTDASTTRIKSDIQDISDSNSYISLKIFAPITNMRIIGIGFFGDDVTTKLPDSTTITITNTTIIQQIPTGAKHYYILFGDDTGGITSDTKTALASAQICAIYGDVLPNTFIPYGYKIPISSAGQTTPIYLGEVQTTRKIKKLVLTGEENWSGSASFRISLSGQIGTIAPICTHYRGVTTEAYGDLADGRITVNGGVGLTLAINDSVNQTSIADWKSYLAQQYAAGTPVTVWYVLATEETGIVNEPLMKIDNYADTVSGITIPTITSKDTFDVETTLKPSEVELTYTGWHDATVEEWDGSQWD